MPGLPLIVIPLNPAVSFLTTACHARSTLLARARTVAEQARRLPQTATAGRNWLRLAARHADKLRHFSLSARITALEQGIL